MVDLVEQARMEDAVVIMSLDYAGLRKAAALRPDWTYGLLNTVSIGDLSRLDIDFLALNAAAASPSFIRHAHSRSIAVYAWTINDPVQMSILLSRNVDGIITDDVAMARQVLAVRAEITPLGRLLVWLAGETGLLRSEDAISGRDDA